MKVSKIWCTRYIQTVSDFIFSSHTWMGGDTTLSAHVKIFTPVGHVGSHLLCLEYRHVVSANWIFVSTQDD